ncbi:Hypothetical protein FKW44_020771, partial [Caligus rogercresseyi]
MVLVDTLMSFAWAAMDLVGSASTAVLTFLQMSIGFRSESGFRSRSLSATRAFLTS